MQVDAAERGDQEDDEEIEEERDRREVANLAGERAGLEALGHGHRDLVAGDEVAIVPGEQPSGTGLLFGGGRERVVGEIDIAEVGFYAEGEVADLRDIVAETVAPAIE